MPTSPVAAMTLPFGESSAAMSVSSASAARTRWLSPTVLAIDEYRAPEEDDRVVELLLGEAIDVARAIGVEVRRRWLAGSGGGSYWRSGVLQVVLDRESPAPQQLAALADALRGDRRLALAQMSPALADFMDFRNAA
ncbi:MAG: hypothetical protein AAFV43_13750 [Planctomycetota bacterium]